MITKKCSKNENKCTYTFLNKKSYQSREITFSKSSKHGPIPNIQILIFILFALSLHLN